jgi:hypothetical protein
LLLDDLCAAGLCEEREEGAHGQEDQLQRRRGELCQPTKTRARRSGAGAGRWSADRRSGVEPPPLEAADEDGRREADEHTAEHELHVEQAHHRRRHVSEAREDFGEEQ